MDELEPRYSTEQVAQRYCVTLRTVQRWVREGRITALNLGGGRLGPYVFRPGDLAEFEAAAAVTGTAHILKRRAEHG